MSGKRVAALLLPLRVTGEGCSGVSHPFSAGLTSFLCRFFPGSFWAGRGRRWERMQDLWSWHLGLC